MTAPGDIREMTAAELADNAAGLLDAVPGLDGSPDHFMLASVAYSLAAIAKAVTGG